MKKILEDGVDLGRPAEGGHLLTFDMLEDPPTGIEQVSDADLWERAHAAKQWSHFSQELHVTNLVAARQNQVHEIDASVLGAPDKLFSPIARPMSAGSPLVPKATPLLATPLPTRAGTLNGETVDASDAIDFRARDEELVPPKEEMEHAADQERLLFGREENAKTPRPTTPAPTPGTRELEMTAFTAERPRLSMAAPRGATPALPAERGSPLMAEVAPPAPPAGVLGRRPTRDASITPESPPEPPKKKRPLEGGGAEGARARGAGTPKRKLEATTSRCTRGAPPRPWRRLWRGRRDGGRAVVVKTGAGYDSVAADELSADAKRAKRAAREGAVGPSPSTGCGVRVREAGGSGSSSRSGSGRGGRERRFGAPALGAICVGASVCGGEVLTTLSTRHVHAQVGHAK